MTMRAAVPLNLLPEMIQAMAWQAFAPWRSWTRGGFPAAFPIVDAAAGESVAVRSHPACRTGLAPILVDY